MTFDWSVNVGNLLVLVAGLIAMLKMLLYQRDLNREMLHTIGATHPERKGILGDVATLKDVQLMHGDMIEAHRHMLSDRRSAEPRRRTEPS